MTTDSHIKSLQTKIAEHSDQEAFKELYYLLYKDLFRFARIFIPQKELAEEVLQDVFTKVWLQSEQLLAVNNLKVYLYTAAKNSAINYQKKYPLQLLTKPDLSAIELSYGSRTPEELMISAQTIAGINKAIQLLPPKCKLIFLMVKEDQLKYKEVAQILNISLKTVEAQMGIAIKKLGAASLFNLS